MLETAVALLLGHMLGDFILQTEAMVAGKNRAALLLGHIAVVLLATWAALGFPLTPWPLLLIGLSHFAADLLKQWHIARCRAHPRPAGFGPFAVDQAAHLAAIWLAASSGPGHGRRASGPNRRFSNGCRGSTTCPRRWRSRRGSSRRSGPADMPCAS